MSARTDSGSGTANTGNQTNTCGDVVVNPGSKSDVQCRYLVIPAFSSGLGSVLSNSGRDLLSMNSNTA